MFAGPPAKTLVRLRPNGGACCLAKQMREVGTPLAVGALDLTNCIRLESYQVTRNIDRCMLLQSLRCIACPLKVRDVLKLMMTSLPHLVELELSLVCDSDATERTVCVHYMASKFIRAKLVHGLRRLYVEVAYDGNFLHLTALLSLCLYVEHVHVHLVRGSFWDALLRCRDLIEGLRNLETFTFTSELPSCRRPDLTDPLDFVSSAAVCANVSYRKSTGTWSCVRLCDLAVECREPRILPFQLVVVVNSDENPAAEWIVASLGNVWTKVRLLCLLLFPEGPSTSSYPTAGISYRESLRLFFCTALKYVIELNISSFHFGPDLDFAELLQDGSLEHLCALSASPCGLRRPSALRRLAQVCPDLADLDVRFERKGSFVQCIGCEGEFLFETEDAAEVSDGATRALFPNGLGRLTLSDVNDTACLWFIKSCSPTATVRLCDCPSSSSPEYARIGRVLATRSMPSCLILQHERLEEILLLADMFHAPSLEYLYILSAVCLSEDIVLASMRALRTGLPRLRYLHVHYRKSPDDGVDERITWIRGSCSGGSCSSGGGEALVRNGPCIQSCSTATFIGLAKPLNRNVQPML
ncbi:uncharacterized protein LOC119400060 [Rhipicephalus sanguineus]|uniref:uncharacterized protein LOC119400060 n=1 Tax=Rhipicephalus sanguineus TaxID=34632 RepID=UPI00189506FD|nr:uncharacterized protein LOC119400060 [Rhipicephalus sanguineus]